MTKNEWLEYFQLVNGRDASPEEIKTALLNGEFQTEEVTETPQDQVNQKPESARIPDLAQESQTTQAETSEPASPGSAPTHNIEPLQGVPNPVPNVPKPSAVTSPLGSTDLNQESANQSTPNPFSPQSGSAGQVPLTGQIQNPQYFGQMIPAKKTTKKLKWILISLASLVGAILLIGSSYSTWRYTSGNIEGTWEMTDYKAYNEDKKRWSTSKDDDAPKDLHSYMKVSKDKSVQYFAYYTATDYVYNYFDDSSKNYLDAEDYSAVTAESYLGSFDKVDQWNKKIKPSMSKSNYEDNLKDIYKDKLGLDKSDAEYQAEEDAKDYGKLMGDKPKYDFTYKIDGDRLTVKRIKVSTGKVVYTAHYKRLSKEKANSVQDDMKDIKSDFKKRIDDYDDYDDSYDDY